MQFYLSCSHDGGVIKTNKFKKVSLIFIIIISVLLNACSTSTSNNMQGKQSSNTNSINNSDASKIENKTSNTNEICNDKEKIKQLDGKDFIVTDGIDTIYLDAPYKNFKTSKQEINQDNNYVGDVTSGEYKYKYYFHKYNDFVIYDSNANYNLKNRKFDEFYITQITLNNSNFKTARGISIEQNLTDVINAYGDGNQTKDNNITTYFYQYKDMQLSFVINQENKITGIILNISVSK